MEKEIIDTKEISLSVEKLVSSGERFFEISSIDDIRLAKELSVSMNMMKSELESRKKLTLIPFKEEISRIGKLIDPYIEKLDSTSKRLINAAFIYESELEKKRKEEERKQLAAGDFSSLKSNQPAKKIVIKTMTVTRVEIVSLDDLPREYLVPDMSLIEDAFKAGRDVPGARMIKEKKPVRR